ncbi:MAG: hypothetical protein IK145_00850 [Bacteroidales bacterium]|nr:hypothetical protein [Bacteroidales bacterium]
MAEETGSQVMKARWIILVLAGMWMSFIPANSQTVRDQIFSDLDKAGGVYYMYPFSEHTVTSPPKGYTPVYMSHYGRHGARYLLNDTQYERSLGVLRAAHERQALTPEGERLWQEARAYFEEECQYRAGELSSLGWDQHYRIAQEIYRDNKAFFKKRPVITAGATQIPRCIVSMAAFCQGLVQMDGRLQVYEAASLTELDELNPHAPENPRRENVVMEEGRYKRKDPWGTGLKDFIDARIDHRAICARFFQNPDFPAPFRGTRAFVTDLYDLVFNMQCVPTQRSLMWVFTSEECYKLWEVNNYIHYMESAPPATLRDLPALWNLVADADRSLASGRPAVRLRFGHDTVFLALMSMMGADGFDQIPSNADGIAQTWHNFRAPMAATMYLLFCKGRRGDIIFKMVVNSEEVRLPLEAVQGPWYRWDDMKLLLSTRFSKQN